MTAAGVEELLSFTYEHLVERVGVCLEDFNRNGINRGDQQRESPGTAGRPKASTMRCDRPNPNYSLVN